MEKFRTLFCKYYIIIKKKYLKIDNLFQNKVSSEDISRIYELFVKNLSDKYFWLINIGNRKTDLELSYAKSNQNGIIINRETLNEIILKNKDENRILEEFDNKNVINYSFFEFTIGFPDGSNYVNDFYYSILKHLPTEEFEISKLDNLDEVPCFTPKNLRLLNTNFYLCQLYSLILMKSLWIFKKSNKLIKIPLSYVILSNLFNTLNIEKKNQEIIIQYGIDYLTCYLDIQTELISNEKLINQAKNLKKTKNKIINKLEEKSSIKEVLKIYTYDELNIGQDNGKYFFPESFWFQYHWFNCVLQIDLIQELLMHKCLIIIIQNYDL